MNPVALYPQPVTRKFRLKFATVLFLQQTNPDWKR
jgi:hypothetical protein